jgi:hypothetical protein
MKFLCGRILPIKIKEMICRSGVQSGKIREIQAINASEVAGYLPGSVTITVYSTLLAGILMNTY